jgi:L-histidine Nalpha-methyltransferase
LTAPGAGAVFREVPQRAESLLADVVAGLSAPVKRLPPKYFYDAVGSALFEAICVLPEYYPTRTEAALLIARRTAIAGALGERCALIEYGSGSSRKSRILIEAVQPAVYVPIDISEHALRAAAQAIEQEFPSVPVVALCADYSHGVALPSLAPYRASRRIIFFPGSTIGNFEPEDAVHFLRSAAEVAGSGGGLLIGVDLKKDKAILDAAYDDPQGVTAAFNLNLLARINRELGANFDLRAFRHRAGYVPSAGRVEMHLESLRDQTVRLGDVTVRFRRGETIHTENSYKYAVPEFQALAERAGFRPRKCWVDERRWFSLHYMSC